MSAPNALTLMALMGPSGGACTFFSHLRWAPVIRLGHCASVATHPALSADLL